jgi:hypothetical protein
MDKQIVGNLHNGTLASNKKELADTCYNMDEP